MFHDAAWLHVLAANSSRKRPEHPGLGVLTGWCPVSSVWQLSGKETELDAWMGTSLNLILRKKTPAHLLIKRRWSFRLWNLSPELYWTSTFKRYFSIQLHLTSIASRCLNTSLYLSENNKSYSIYHLKIWNKSHFQLFALSALFRFSPPSLSPVPPEHRHFTFFQPELPKTNYGILKTLHFCSSHFSGCEIGQWCIMCLG